MEPEMTASWVIALVIVALLATVVLAPIGVAMIAGRTYSGVRAAIRRRRAARLERTGGYR